MEPDSVGERNGLRPGDVVLAVNGLSGMSNYQVVEMIRTLAGDITFLVAQAPVKHGAAGASAGPSGGATPRPNY